MSLDNNLISGGRLLPGAMKQSDINKNKEDGPGIRKGMVLHGRIASIFRGTVKVSFDLGEGTPKKIYYVNRESARKFFGIRKGSPNDDLDIALKIVDRVKQEKNQRRETLGNIKETIRKNPEGVGKGKDAPIIEKEADNSSSKPVTSVKDPKLSSSRSPEGKNPVTPQTPTRLVRSDSRRLPTNRMGNLIVEPEEDDEGDTAASSPEEDDDSDTAASSFEELEIDVYEKDRDDYLHEKGESTVEEIPETTTSEKTAEDLDWLYKPKFDDSRPKVGDSHVPPKSKTQPHPFVVESTLSEEHLNYPNIVDNWLTTQTNNKKIIEKLHPETKAYLKNKLEYNYHHLLFDPKKVMDGTSSQSILEINRLIPKLKELGLELGPAVDEGDCFFDAVAQGLKRLGKLKNLQGTLDENIQEVRETARTTAISLRDALAGSQKKEGNEQEAEEENVNRIANRGTVDQLWKDYAISWKAFSKSFSAYDSIDDYIKRVSYQFTGGENKDLQQAEWGSPNLDARLLAKAYNVRIVAYGFLEDFQDTFLPDRIPDNDTVMDEIVIVNARSHFMATRPIKK